MLRHRLVAAPAAALVALLIAAPRVRADYGYDTSVVITSVIGAGGVIVNAPGTGGTFTSTNGTVVTLGDVLGQGPFAVGSVLVQKAANVAVTTTSAVADSFTINYTILTTITDPFPGGSTGTPSISGTMTFTGIETGGGSFSGTVTNHYLLALSSGPVNINGHTYFINVLPALNALFVAPTIGAPVGSSGGSLSEAIAPREGAVPEPSSLALCGLGLAAVGGLAARRKAAVG
jgi:hypothetical protein